VKSIFLCGIDVNVGEAEAMRFLAALTTSAMDMARSNAAEEMDYAAAAIETRGRDVGQDGAYHS
jgi:hypothetical protein